MNRNNKSNIQLGFFGVNKNIQFEPTRKLYEGIVVKYLNEKNYGFIKMDNLEEIFVHINNMEDKSINYLKAFCL